MQQETVMTRPRRSVNALPSRDVPPVIRHATRATNKRRRLAGALAAAVVCTMATLPAAARAQAYPERPIRLIIPYAAGGTTDIMARTLQDPLQKSLGQVIVVDNKPGAGGIIAARDTIHAKPDGYTLLFVNNGNLAAVPQIVKEANYDARRDFTPIAMVSTAAMLAVVPASLPVDDLKGLIDHARKNPVSYATAGVGSFGHLATELLASKAGVRLTHVPYKGQGPTLNAVVAGEVQLLVTSPSGAMNEFIANRRLKLLGVTSAQESPLNPGIPPIGTVLPGYEAESWFAIVGPAGMPAAIVDRLNDAITQALRHADVQQRFRTFGVVAKSASPSEVAAMTVREIERWTPVIRDNDIRAD